MLFVVCCTNVRIGFNLYPKNFNIEEFIMYVKRNGFFHRNRHNQNRYWMRETINETLRNSFFQDPEIEREMAACEELVKEDKMSSFVAAKRLLDIYFSKR